VITLTNPDVTGSSVPSLTFEVACDGREDLQESTASLGQYAIGVADLLGAATHRRNLGAVASLRPQWPILVASLSSMLPSGRGVTNYGVLRSHSSPRMTSLSPSREARTYAKANPPRLAAFCVFPPSSTCVFRSSQTYNPTPVLLLAWYVDKDTTRAFSELRRPYESHRQASSPDGGGLYKVLYSISGSSSRELAGLWICECNGSVFSDLRRTTLTIIQGLY